MTPHLSLIPILHSTSSLGKGFYTMPLFKEPWERIASMCGSALWRAAFPGPAGFHNGILAQVGLAWARNDQMSEGPLLGLFPDPLYCLLKTITETALTVAEGGRILDHLVCSRARSSGSSCSPSSPTPRTLAASRTNLPSWR